MLAFGCSPLDACLWMLALFVPLLSLVAIERVSQPRVSVSSRSQRSHRSHRSHTITLSPLSRAALAADTLQRVAVPLSARPSQQSAAILNHADCRLWKWIQCARGGALAQLAVLWHFDQFGDWPNNAGLLCVCYPRREMRKRALSMLALAVSP